MTRVKVGLDQWVIANNSGNVQLITNGLSGCVALGLEGARQFCLTHVYSNCDSKNWDSYKERLSIMLSKMDGISRASLIYSEETSSKLSGILCEWLSNEVNVGDVERYTASGCRMYYGGAWGCEVMRYDEDNRDLYRHGYTKASEAGIHIHAWGGLSDDAADAD